NPRGRPRQHTAPHTVVQPHQTEVQPPQTETMTSPPSKTMTSPPVERLTRPPVQRMTTRSVEKINKLSVRRYSQRGRGQSSGSTGRGRNAGDFICTQESEAGN
ncbi:hydroxyproline-rich glycoprotein family protein, partial [Striga asiatica]